MLKLWLKGEELNQTLDAQEESADYLELGELMAKDALNRLKAAAEHFREEYQTPRRRSIKKR